MERDDLNDVSAAIGTLTTLAEYFEDNNLRKWPRYWKGADGGTSNMSYEIHGVEDKEFVRAMERIYGDGRDISVTLSGLNDILSVKYTPRLTPFVEKLESYLEWIPDCVEILGNAKRLVRERPEYKIDCVLPARVRRVPAP